MECKTLRSENERLESAINDLRSNIDLANQEIHKYNNDISLAKLLESEYMEEIEFQKKAKSSIKQDLLKEIKQVKDDLSNLKESHEHQMVHQAKTIESLKSQIKERKHALTLNEKNVVKNDDINQATERNSELKRDIDLVTDELATVQEDYEDLKLENQELHVSQQFFMKKLGDLKNSVRVKNIELTEIQDLMQDLQKKAFDNKLKVDSLKFKPLDPAKKGNSMFGEVEDSCVKLLHKLEQLKKFNAGLEEDFKGDFKKMQVLIQEYPKKKKSLEESNIDVNEYQAELDKFLSSMPFLEGKIEEYKSEILGECEFVAKQPDNFNVPYVNHKIKSLWKQAIDSGDELNNASKEVLTTFQTLEDVNKQLRSTERENLLLDCKMDELNLVLLKLKRDVHFDEIKENSFVKEVLDGSQSEKKLLKENSIFSNEVVKEDANLVLKQEDSYND